MQKVWRGHRARVACHQLWLHELEQHVSTAKRRSACEALAPESTPSGRQLPNPILARFFAAAQPESTAQLPLLCNVCALARECLAHCADTPQCPIRQLDAARIAATALRTLAYHRCAACSGCPQQLAGADGSDTTHIALRTVDFVAARTPASSVCMMRRDAMRLALEQPLDTAQHERAQQQGAVLCQALHALLTMQAGDTSSCVAAYLAEQGMLLQLAVVLAALPEAREQQLCAAESIGVAFCEAWHPGADAPPWGWALFCVPRLSLRCTALQRHAPVLLRLALWSLATLSRSAPTITTQTVAEVGSAAGHVGLVHDLMRVADQLDIGSADPPRARAAQCGLQLLSGLLQAAMAPSAGALGRAEATALLATGRIVLALVPASAREALVHDSVRALAGQRRGAAVVHRTAWLRGTSTAAHGEGAGAWCYLPTVDFAELRGELDPEAALPGRTADGDVLMSDASTSPRSSDACVTFEVSLAAPELLDRLASGALAGGGTEANGEAMVAAGELSQWLLMLQELCASDALVRQQLETAWKESALRLVRVLWRGLLQPALASGALQPASSSKATAAAAPWLLPLSALCSLYSHFLETEADSVIFSEAVRTSDALPAHACLHARWFREQLRNALWLEMPNAHLCVNPFPHAQAPIPLSELGGDQCATAAQFIPFLRDALLKIFVDTGARGGAGQSQSLFRPATTNPTPSADSTPAQAPDGTARATVVTGFKVVGGRLLGQLHSRAARRDDVLDNWFHAPGVQRAQFRKGASPAC